MSILKQKCKFWNKNVDFETKNRFETMSILKNVDFETKMSILNTKMSILKTKMSILKQ